MVLVSNMLQVTDKTYLELSHVFNFHQIVQNNLRL